MCTLIVARDIFPNFPLVVASNRDEHHLRPSTPPIWQRREARSFYAPRDEVRGGTWIGVAPHGIFAALTNRDDVSHVVGGISRGQIVSRALCAPSAYAAMEELLHHNDGRHNGFHLAVADQESAWIVWYDGTVVQSTELKTGLHILTGFGFGLDHVARAREVCDRFERQVVRHDPTPDMLNGLLSFHADYHPRNASCIHYEHRAHCTRSSMIVRANADWSTFDTWHREGPACAGAFQPIVTVPILNAEAAS